MIMVGANTIRDVIAFPKTARATCLLTGAPSEVKQGQLEEACLSEFRKKISERRTRENKELDSRLFCLFTKGLLKI